ncbi:MAG TPA: hypothetical protein VHX88_06210 [Solirubrobacteraceae bacterium]|nr:hypothetical protein [Solirubrobacteraceae bacterium]
MVYERAELSIAPGQEETSQAAMHSGGLDLLAGAVGCHPVVLARGVEPSSSLLPVQWDEFDSHIKVTETPEFGCLREIAGPFLGGAPTVGHFAPTA